MRIGMTGHQDIPPMAIGYIRHHIEGVITELTNDLVGVSSLAAGADQLFASIILERGGKLHAIIPCQGYETTFSEKDELEQFTKLINKAAKVSILDYPEPSQDAYLNAGYYVVDNSDLLLAVWDGKPAVGKGGTADIVKYAQRRNKEIKVLWPDGINR